MDLILKYFPDLSVGQIEKFRLLENIYSEWNSRINVISRRDMDNFYERHVLHSLSLAKLIDFTEDTRILDLGTGGGFPGIPLAVIFEKCRFILADSVKKKIRVVQEAVSRLQLKNTEPANQRAENIHDQFDFVITRATASAEKLISWTSGKFLQENRNELPNGILALKGGDLEEELQNIKSRTRVFDISSFFEEPFFRTKKIVHVGNTRNN